MRLCVVSALTYGLRYIVIDVSSSLTWCHGHALALCVHAHFHTLYACYIYYWYAFSLYFSATSRGRTLAIFYTLYAEYSVRLSLHLLAYFSFLCGHTISLSRFVSCDCVSSASAQLREAMTPSWQRICLRSSSARQRKQSIFARPLPNAKKIAPPKREKLPVLPSSLDM